jgi:hypothetical protein
MLKGAAPYRGTRLHSAISSTNRNSAMAIFSNPLLLESLMRKADEPESWERVPLESGGFASGGNLDQPVPIPLARAGESRSGTSAIPVIYGGPNAETADQNERQRALKLRAQGQSWNEIWKSTGWGPTVEGKWAFDISDHDATLNDRGDTVGEILNHPRLFEAYPNLRNIRFKLQELAPDRLGHYELPKSGQPPTIVINAALNNRERLETLLHELQHAIQFQEGFAFGGSPEGLKRIIKKRGGIGPEKTIDPNRAYELLAGEDQAESVVRRREMTPERRREVPPWESENVPRDRQIILRWKGNTPGLRNQADDDSDFPIPSAQPPIFFE